MRPERDTRPLGAEVRLLDYVGSVRRSWWVVAAVVVVAVALVGLHAVGERPLAQAQATVTLGAALGADLSGTLPEAARPSIVMLTAYLATGSVLQRAAEKAGATASSLQQHLSVTTAADSTSSAVSPSPPVVAQITLKGPYARRRAVAAVQSLGDSVLRWANVYVTSVRRILTRDATTLSAAARQLQHAQRSLERRLAEPVGGLPSAARAASLSLLSATSNRLHSVSSRMRSEEIALAALPVSRAAYLQRPAGAIVTAQRRVFALLVAGLTGLTIGVLAALAHDRRLLRRPGLR